VCSKTSKHIREKTILCLGNAYDISINHIHNLRRSIMYFFNYEKIKLQKLNLIAFIRNVFLLLH